MPVNLLSDSSMPNISKASNIVSVSEQPRQVKVLFNLGGRRWTKDGKTNWFNSVTAWRIEKVGSDAVVTSITKRVNGGTIGLPDRIKHFKEYYHLLAQKL